MRLVMLSSMHLIFKTYPNIFDFKHNAKVVPRRRLEISLQAQAAHQAEPYKAAR